MNEIWIIKGLRSAMQKHGMNVKGKVFLVDQPGMGGRQMNRAGFLQKFGNRSLEFHQRISQSY